MNKKGFTIVEIISVIVLLGLIIGLASTGVMNSAKKAKERTLNTKIKNLEKAAVIYGQDNRNKFTVSNTSCNLCEKNKEADNSCKGTLYNDKCYINNCYCYEKTITVTDLIDPNGDGDTSDGYIKADDKSGNILNSTDESKYLNDCEIQIYQKYGKTYAVYTKTKKNPDGTLSTTYNQNCWFQTSTPDE